MAKAIELGSCLSFYVDNQRYALPVQNIEELIYADTVETSTLPLRASASRGVMRWRDRVIPLLDLRTVFGMQTLQDQTQTLLDMLTQREADHVHWIRELETSTLEDRPFTLATDPHQCGFGKWYDALRSNKHALMSFTNHHSGLLRVVNAFDDPHQAIHGLAKQVDELRRNHQVDEALQLIDKARNTTLQTMVLLFGQARDLIRQLYRAMIVVVHQDGEWIALFIDSIDRITVLVSEDVSFEDVKTEHGPLPLQAARAPDREELILEMSINSLFHACNGPKKSAA